MNEEENSRFGTIQVTFDAIIRDIKFKFEKEEWRRNVLQAMPKGEHNADVTWDGEYYISYPRQRLEDAEAGKTKLTIHPDIKIERRKECLRDFYVYKYYVCKASTFLGPMTLENVDLKRLAYIELTSNDTLLTRISAPTTNVLRFFKSDLHMGFVWHHNWHINLFFDAPQEQIPVIKYTTGSIIHPCLLDEPPETMKINLVNADGIKESIQFSCGVSVNKRCFSGDLRAYRSDYIPKSVSIEIPDNDRKLPAKELLEKYRDVAWEGIWP